MEMVKENDLVEAEVKAIFPYGAFATIKSLKSPEEENFSEIKSSQITGFIYIQDISWDKINHPSECLEIGQKIKAKILKNKNETSKGEQNKIALSIKELTKNPKAQLLEEFKEGELVNCKVTELSEHGIFAHFSKKPEAGEKQEISKQYEGFVHNSEISWEKEEQNNKKFKPNDQFEAKIIELDIDKKKVPLSIKSLQESPVKIYCQSFKENDILELKISKALQYGLILTLSDKLEVFIHAKDILWEKDKDSYEYLLRSYKPDDLIKVKYLGYCDTLNRVKLTTKGFNNNEDPFIKYKDSLAEGKIIDVSVVDVKVDKIFVSIFGALISTVKSFEFPKNLTPSDLKIGQNIKVKIIGFEDSANSIPILSIKEQETEEYKKTKEKYNTTTQSTSSLAEILEFALDKAAKKNA
jgi:small subunit ribosomal protein S1